VIYTLTKYRVVEAATIPVEVHTLVGHPMLALETVNVGQGTEIDSLVPGWYTTLV